MDCAKEGDTPEWLIWPSFITRPGSLLLDQACDNGLAPSNEDCWSLFGNGCYASLHMYQEQSQLAQCEHPLYIANISVPSSQAAHKLSLAAHLHSVPAWSRLVGGQRNIIVIHISSSTPRL